MNQFLIDRIYQKLISFQSPIKKNKLKSLRDAFEGAEESSCGKTKSAEANRYILGALTSFWKVQSGKVINYKNLLPFPLSPIPLNIVNGDDSRRKIKTSNLKDVIVRA